MPVWAIILIVLGVLFFVVLPAFIFDYAGRQTVKTMSRDYQGFKNLNMDISFYKNGPTAKLAEEGVEFMKSLPQEEVHIKSFDDLNLQAYVFMNEKKTNKFFLGMHGFKSGPLHEYGPYIKRYLDLGFNVILPCERAHYKSEGKYLTMGAKERYDVLSWTRYIVDRFGEDTKILIQGISMGGATVCLASNLDLPKQVIGIISDCAYSSIKDQMVYTMKHNFKIPTWPLVNIIGMHVKMKVGVDFNAESPLDAVKESKVPIFFAHGEKDEMVPSKFVNELYEACGNKKKLYVVEGANHAEAGPTNLDNYFNEITKFFNIK